ncbi:MAG: amidohydrolase/deacetylase family metallohydrolase [Liquorilactobacillus nagelii]|jgi:dihydroorotase|uniref:amidohydrolase/deacetylase family metallohydrolase n=1 Tax=Liquorilactobacillus nagelii TaxID=82688 RepID=UPI00242B7FD4|nr:amidohydrolase/deacetylase family metallohydrolase [Liquorilactobacillus nagelii]MCI1921651.1 amidohydrolase/deacetylase family metallohydrolase [Liquorilactobacillus nagelii]MCI1976317.1 amidohydrolase/deacetylase family metallohydrolase [Liquorilactobacillus nagelii]
MLDLYLKNGKTVDGKNIEVGILDGKIMALSQHLADISAKKTVDLKGRFLSAGWIDDHTHCYEKLSLYFDDPDEDGTKTGVTTVIDAGSTGSDNIEDFYKITRNKKTNVLAMINISKTGILAQDELGDISKIQENQLIKAIYDYPDFIVGIKARESHSVVINNDVLPLLAAKKIQHKLGGNFPLMVHVGANPPELRKILNLMGKNDILTHAYNGKSNGILDDQENIKSFVWEAYRRGVIFDIGHGTDSFNFKTFSIAIKDGLVPKSISTDIYNRNRNNGPVYDMATTLEKIMLFGFSLSQVIDMVTKEPAKNFHLITKGRLQLGFDADITVFEIQNKNKVLTDSNGNKRSTDKSIKPVYSIVGGKIYKAGGNN